MKCENDTAATIDVVEVIGQGGKPSAFKIVNRFLKYYTTNITILKLQLSFEPTSHMLHDLWFANLTIFQTNIPHALIAPFLARHPAITNLALDVCNATTATAAVACPLTSCYLPNIEHLSCPKGCVRPLLSAVMPASPLGKLQVIQHTAQDSTFPLQDLFNFHRIPTSSHLSHLHLDFDHTVPSLLQAISKGAPQLETLKLVESKFSDSVCLSFLTHIILTRVSEQDKIPLWADAYTWECNLVSFRNLTRLLIRTSRSITLEETPSSEGKDKLGCPKHLKEALHLEDEELELELKLAHQRQQEDMVVRRWLIRPPDSLTQVLIWTKAFTGRTNGERLADWGLRYDESWGSRQWVVFRNRPAKDEEVCGGVFI